MNFEESEKLCLQNSVLLADPSLRDPNFRRTVLYLSYHTEQNGAEGFVLNRPLDRLVGELGVHLEVPELASVPVYLGGPVATEHLVFASLYWNPTLQQLEFNNRLSAKEAAARLEEGFTVRAFIGHSGWAAGQLEGELRENAWIPHRPQGAIFEDDGPIMWIKTMEKISPFHYLLSKTPEDPSLN